MHMICIRAYLQKFHLITLLNIQTNIFELMLYDFIKYCAPILRWKYQVIYQYRNIVAFVNIYP